MGFSHGSRRSSLVDCALHLNDAIKAADNAVNEAQSKANALRIAGAIIVAVVNMASMGHLELPREISLVQSPSNGVNQKWTMNGIDVHGLIHFVFVDEILRHPD